jgi:hypothetical protein
MQDYEIVHNYTFDAILGTVTFNSYVSIFIEDIQSITNITTGEVIYSPGDGEQGLGGTVAGNVLTLQYYNGGGFLVPPSSSDDLRIILAAQTAPIICGGGGSGNFVDEEVPLGLINSINDTFTLVNTPVIGSVKIYLNGQRLTNGVDYTYVTNIITFTTIPFTGDGLIADYRY